MIRRPAPAEIERFLERCEKLPLSYGPTGIVWRPAAAGRLDGQPVVRLLQARFRSDSAAAMRRAVR
mgnify:CR=1 FL=1